MRKEIIKIIFIVTVVIIIIFNIVDLVVNIKDLNMIDVACASQIKIAYTEKYKPLKLEFNFRVVMIYCGISKI